jgi:hypothetical protein
MNLLPEGLSQQQHMKMTFQISFKALSGRGYRFPDKIMLQMKKVPWRTAAGELIINPQDCVEFRCLSVQSPV